jgi:hypothetical protein
MNINELMSLLIQWGHIKNLVTFAISKVEGLLHFGHINFQGWANYMYRYQPTKRDVHPGLALGNHFILLQKICGVDLVDLGNFDFFIKRQVVHYLHSSKNLAILDFSHNVLRRKKDITKRHS